MLAHKLDNAVAGTVLAIVIMVAASAALWRSQKATDPSAAKSDRLDTAPQVDCSYTAWPYGCDWQLHAPPDPPKHSKFGRRGQRRHALRRVVS